MVWCFDRTYFTTETHRLDVVTEGEQAGLNFISEAATPVEVSTGIREKDVLDLMMDTLLDRPGVH